MTTGLQHSADAPSPRGPAGTAGTGAGPPLADQSDVLNPGRTQASSVRLARVAGLLYLVVAIFGGFAQIVRVNVYVPGDADTTTANIVANPPWSGSASWPT